MPIPKRKPDEDRTDFLSRCMSDPKMNEEYKENSQRYAVCMQSAKASQGDQVKDNYYDQVFGSTEIVTDEKQMYIPDDSEYVDFGETVEEYTIGLQYGKPPKNDPRKTPAPKKDQKKGSKKNKPDSAKDDKGKITLSKNTEDKLKALVTKHNAKDKGSKVTLGMLKAVYRRGAGAFSTSHHPNMSRDGWAMARVNAFLYLMRNGRPSNPNYKQDNDLLPKAHPRSSKANEDDSSMYIAKIKKMHEQLMNLDKILSSIPVEFEEWTKDKISKCEHYVQSIFDAVLYGDKDVEDEYEDEDKVESAYKYENPKTGEIYLYTRQGVYRKDGTVLVFKGKAAEKKKNVKLNKPFRTPKGPKKFSVYVKNEKGNVVKVNFGDPNMDIKRDDPQRRKNFRARHQCDTNPGPKWKARYWSCKFWSSKDVSDLT